MFGLLSEQVKITRCLNAVAAGTSEQAGTALDMDGFDGVVFVAPVGTLTATQVTSLKAQQSSDNGVADGFSDLEGSEVGPLADTDGNKMMVLDMYRTMKRYVKPVVGRGTANAVLDGIIAIQYQSRDVPTTNPASVAALVAVMSPDEGTA